MAKAKKKKIKKKKKKVQKRGEGGRTFLYILYIIKKQTNTMKTNTTIENKYTFQFQLSRVEKLFNDGEITEQQRNFYITSINEEKNKQTNTMNKQEIGRAHV